MLKFSKANKKLLGKHYDNLARHSLWSIKFS